MERIKVLIRKRKKFFLRELKTWPKVMLHLEFLLYQHAPLRTFVRNSRTALQKHAQICDIVRTIHVDK